MVGRAVANVGAGRGRNRKKWQAATSVPVEREALLNHQLKPNLVDETAAGRNKGGLVAPRRRPRIMLDDGRRTAIAAAAPERAEK